MEDCSPTSRMYEDVSTIVSCATQMSNLITALVDWTGVNSSAGEATLTAVDVLSVCTNVVRSCRKGLPCPTGVLLDGTRPASICHDLLARLICLWACVAHWRPHQMLAACLSVTLEVMKSFPDLVEVDEERLRHVLSIALSNAVKVRSVCGCCTLHSMLVWT